MSGIELLDHLHAGAAILGDLINVGALHKTHANICVAKAVGRPRIVVPVKLEIGALEDAVEQLEGTSNNDGFFVDRSLAWRTGDFGS